MSEPKILSRALRNFVDTAGWTFAKTMPEWPHEYIIRDRVVDEHFPKLARHIRAHGFQGRFYRRVLTYYAEDGLLYWTMGAPVEETTIINRCNEEGSYENRLRNGTLPHDNQAKKETEQYGAANPYPSSQNHLVGHRNHMTISQYENKWENLLL